MSHLRTVREEFARQAETFAGAPLLNATDLTDQLAEIAISRPTDRVVDIACGPGLLLPALAARAASVVGVDFTPEVLELARKRLPAATTNVALARGVAEQLPFRDGAFDAAVLRLALHHVEEPVTVLREVHRLLRPGGRVAVLDILTSADEETAALHNAIERLRDPSHTSLVALHELTASVEAAGFGVTRSTTFDKPRPFKGWATIISDARRMASLETVMRQLARTGVSMGIDLREESGELLFTYTFALVVGEK